MSGIVLFDGECNFCDQSVQFIIKRDPEGYFSFASLQSEIGQELLHKHQIPTHTDSFILIEDNQAYTKSSAALNVCKHLKGAWKGLRIFTLVPKFVRDRVYDVIAKNRYKWFGKKDSCMLPSKEIRKRFL
ncbi:MULTISPECIES: thiol-disulfide oxidoreductase DCC family protein [Pontibacillus]|uniref:Thiol-disulfide oxidoreductase DCC family protein n=1 Tax=Pontibacillus chungwhensis TaxID=265426 RepID=A0ABY8V0S8_9BACI|nr:thiol-disulfide oxidoreductase DCC family protein [Pontibacillus chungwhensis]MCD5324607.1 thiol-disulfide oxidoreductase DCC family protein [Pontibacillus sp. HN14]WIF99098.1 thiol-disulfide oxidoreductase DCC family protein [Pontibacillus chungwhensis]